MHCDNSLIGSSIVMEKTLNHLSTTSTLILSLNPHSAIVLKWHAQFHGLATAIHETFGLVLGALSPLGTAFLPPGYPGCQIQGRQKAGRVCFSCAGKVVGSAVIH